MLLQHFHSSSLTRSLTPCHARVFHPPGATAVDHLILTVDGFNAAKATELYPTLKQMEQASVEPSLDVVQNILPQRILGTTLTQHPQLLSVDMSAWIEFLEAFGFEESAIQELLRSSPEVFYNSNVFQVSPPLYCRTHSRDHPSKLDRCSYKEIIG